MLYYENFSIHKDCWPYNYSLLALYHPVFLGILFQASLLFKVTQFSENWSL